MATVSVIMVAYNHEKYLGQAIEGVVCQRTDFDFELVIAEDCSPDNTRNIALAYQQKYPRLIKIITSDTNVGFGENFARAKEYCTSEFIAICDGDDYWADNHKLQKQIDFLRAHRECTLCAHKVQLFNDTEQRYGVLWPVNDYPPVTDLGTFLKKDLIYHSASLVFRREIWDVVDETWSLLPYWDYFIKVLAGEKGKLGFINQLMSIYRIHNESMTNKDTYGFIKKEITHFKILLSYLSYNPSYKRAMLGKVVNRSIAYHYLSGDKSLYAGDMGDLKKHTGNLADRVYLWGAILGSNIVVRVKAIKTAKKIYAWVDLMRTRRRLVS